MIRRLFWFTLGAGVAMFLFVRIRKVLSQASPEAMSQRVAGAAAGMGESARNFVERVRAGMAEREAELRDELGLPE